MVATLALVAVRARPAPPPPGTAPTLTEALAVGSTLPAPGTVRFAEGARVTLSSGTTLHLAGRTLDAMDLRLWAGHASFEVVPGGRRRWSIDCGLARVTVVGTGFDLDLDEARLRVAVRHGAVRVEGSTVEGGARTVGAGEALDVPARRDDPAVPQAPAPLLDAGGLASTRPSTPRRLPSPAVRAPIDASMEPPPDVAVRAAPSVDPAEELWQRADGARRAQRHADAATLLAELVDRYPASARAPMAAFVMGRDHLRVLRRPMAAAAAYARALELGLAEGLREEAWLGLVESRWQSGDRAGALDAARRYRTAYPRGVHREYIDGLVGAAP